MADQLQFRFVNRLDGERIAEVPGRHLISGNPFDDRAFQRSAGDQGWAGLATFQHRLPGAQVKPALVLLAAVALGTLDLENELHLAGQFHPCAEVGVQVAGRRPFSGRAGIDPLPNGGDFCLIQPGSPFGWHLARRHELEQMARLRLAGHDGWVTAFPSF